jgi:hypothetical protein
VEKERKNAEKNAKFLQKNAAAEAASSASTADTREEEA